jgi:TonB family protein
VREQRLLTCLLASFTLHTAFLAFVPSFLSRPPSFLKTPLWVDLVDLKEMSPPAPATLDTMAVPGPSPQALDRPPTKQAVPSKESRSAPSAPQEITNAHVPDSRRLPSSRELIPTVSSLLGLQRAHDNPLSVESSQDPGQGLHHGREYDAYIREIKEAVRNHWKVSGDGDPSRGTTVIRVLIDSKGSLASLDLLKSSGMILHDYEALEAIKQSFPFRSPPEPLLDKNGKLSIRFSFHYLLTPQG